MSETNGSASHPLPGGQAGASAHGDAEHPMGTLRGYLTGFVLSVILTAIPFWLVMGNVFGDKVLTSIVIMAFAAVQIMVHMVYFLHMNTKSEGGWTVISMVFALILVVVTLAGSIWVMYHLDQNMMPMAPHGTPPRP